MTMNTVILDNRKKNKIMEILIAIGVFILLMSPIFLSYKLDSGAISIKNYTILLSIIAFIIFIIVLTYMRK